MAENNSSGFERHAQTVIQVVMAASIIWGVTELVSIGKSMVKLEVQQTNSANEVLQLKTEVNNLRVQLTGVANAAANAASAAAATAAAVATASNKPPARYP